MKRIDYPSPSPRESELPYSEFHYKIKGRIYLPEPEVSNLSSFLDVLTGRRSRRTFKAVSNEMLNAILWYSARAIIIAPQPNNSRWQHRPSPSAGGRHPIDLFVFGEQRDSQSVSIYDPVAHALCKLVVDESTELDQLIDIINRVLPLEDSTVIMLGAQFDRTLSKYEDGESLVWRDAGSLITTISLVAESLDLNCCALGITGEPFLSQMLNSGSKVLGVGGVLIGER